MIGRFAPTPSGRMHLGNLYCALMAWLSARSQGGSFIVRIEDLDAGRCRFAPHIPQVFDDLRWLGIDWDAGEDPASFQSNRSGIYEEYFEKLKQSAEIYPCYCSRAELHAASAPHLADGQPLYDGRCYCAWKAEANADALPSAGRSPARLNPAERNPAERNPAGLNSSGRRPAWRIHLPDEEVVFTDLVMGKYRERLATECGDFILRRSDGVYAYQLAVVVDDALSGVTEVVRGSDLLSSTPRQIYLHRLWGFPQPTYAHLPLLVGADGHRLAKRLGDLDAGTLREMTTAPELIGKLAASLHLIDRPEPLTARELIAHFRWDAIPKSNVRSVVGE